MRLWLTGVVTLRGYTHEGRGSAKTKRSYGLTVSIPKGGGTCCARRRLQKKFEFMYRLCVKNSQKKDSTRAKGGYVLSTYVLAVTSHTRVGSDRLHLGGCHLPPLGEGYYFFFHKLVQVQYQNSIWKIVPYVSVTYPPLRVYSTHIR